MDEQVHRFGMSRRLLPGGGCSDHGLKVELAGVDAQAYERHLVIRFVADVADNSHAQLAREHVGWLGRCQVSTEKRADRQQQPSAVSRCKCSNPTIVSIPPS